MAVALVDEEFVESDNERLARLFAEQMAATAPAEPPAPKAPRVPMSKVLLDTMAATASLLTVRLALVLTVIFAFILALLVVQSPSTPGLIALGIFSALIFPLAWLSAGRVT